MTAYLEGLAFVGAFLGLFFLGLLMMLPLGRYLATRSSAWPSRPMSNRERKARWANRYHQATPIQPNGWRWKWLTTRTTGE